MTDRSLGVRASDFMNTRLFTVSPDMRVYEVVKALLKKKVSGAPVVENNKLVGVLSEKDCIHALMRAVNEGLPPSRVRDVMSTDLITVRPDAHMMDVAHYFLTLPIRRIPVVNHDGELVGQVSRRDLLQAAVSVFEESPDRGEAVLYLSATGATRPH